MSFINTYQEFKISTIGAQRIELCLLGPKPSVLPVYDAPKKAVTLLFTFIAIWATAR